MLQEPGWLCHPPKKPCPGAGHGLTPSLPVCSPLPISLLFSPIPTLHLPTGGTRLCSPRCEPKPSTATTPQPRFSSGAGAKHPFCFPAEKSWPFGGVIYTQRIEAESGAQRRNLGMGASKTQPRAPVQKRSGTAPVRKGFPCRESSVGSKGEGVNTLETISEKGKAGNIVL